MFSTSLGHKYYKRNLIHKQQNMVFVVEKGKNFHLSYIYKTISSLQRKDRTPQSMATASFFPPGISSIQGWALKRKSGRSNKPFSVMAQQQKQQELVKEQEEQQVQQNQTSLPQQQQEPQGRAGVQQQPLQPLAKSKNMGREYGGQWLSSVTRHVRIYAAYIDPVTHAFDQTQMDKLTLLLDPTNEFVWTPETCQKVYGYFQELVDHYEGAPLTEYTLRLIGSDIEHYIRKLLYDGEINYNMNARVLNFSMGKPRVKFNSSQIQDVQ